VDRGISKQRESLWPAVLKTSFGSRVRIDVLLIRPMLELLALLLSAFASLFKSTERLEVKNLVVPTENLILYDERGLLKGPRSVPDLRSFAAGTRRDFSVIAKDLVPAHIWDALAKTGGEAGWYGSSAA
jgi:hypothetical protein